MNILNVCWHKVTLKKVMITAIFFGYLIQVSPVFAIPSPELIIGSVSSLSQLFAVGFAMVSGVAAAVGAKFGFKKKTGAVQSTFLVNSVIVLVLLLSASVGYIFYQNNQTSIAQQARLRATLTRPAQFTGTKILDENLKETSLIDQKNSTLGISTDQAEEILNATNSTLETLLLDVREDAEFMMGTLPGARHIRFPDIAKAGLDLKNKKVVLVCHNGNRSSETCARLAAMGIDCSFIAGGLEKWIVEGRGFTDSTVRGLSDLRAISDYKNKEVLISTVQFEMMIAQGDIQIVDTRYPKDFASNHLPNAINIPLRALPTDALNIALSKLENKPTVVACYDRRSCFMGQVLGLEIANLGIDYLGRYTTPWDYFIAPPLKPHIQEWLANKDKTLWDRTVASLSDWLLLVSAKTHLLVGVLALSLISRLLILPIAIKSEKDQIALTAHKVALDCLKKRLKDDPKRRARAVQNYYNKLGLTPLRNLTALLFLPVMMLGLSATEQAAVLAVQGQFLWLPTLAAPDATYLFPTLFSILAGLYLHITLASTFKRRIVSWGLAVPALFALVFQLNAAGTIYLNISLALLLLQRAYVTGALGQLKDNLGQVWRRWRVKHMLHGIIPLHHADALKTCGNKSYRLAQLENAGFKVPKGIVIDNEILVKYPKMTAVQRAQFFDRLWQMIGQKKCVVRSSGADEDGAGQSYAGVFDSVLGVARNNLQTAFEQVLTSFQSSRAGSYQTGALSGHCGNILIQQMIHAQYSGVLFTQDPAAPGQMMVELAKGTADDLVSGRVTPLNLRFGKYTHQSCGDQNAPIDLAELLKMGRDIEHLFKCPQDIEWAYYDEEFFFVQSRDITTLNKGSVTEQARQKEWGRFFDKFSGSTLDGPVLKQDEMSEVLPRPTRLSFSIMASLWAPGGSVDLACQSLGLNYNMPEGDSGHLYQLFGKVYSDVAMKAKIALRLPKSIERTLEKRCGQVERNFHQNFLPELHKEIAYWDAIDFAKLNLEHQLECVAKLARYFVDETYVTAEKINILTSFLNLKAEAECQRLDLNVLQVMQAPMPHSPSRIMMLASEQPVDERKQYLINALGHRAVFDYELAMPRYLETPEMLWTLARSNTKPLYLHAEEKTDAVKAALPDIVVMALRFQDLKEYAKHESLRVFAVLRRVLRSIDHKLGGTGLVFHLSLGELLGLNDSNLRLLKKCASDRHKVMQLTKAFGANNAALSLYDCEVQSNPNSVVGKQTGDMHGTWVSGGRDVIGRTYNVQDNDGLEEDDLMGFTKGDILVCKMMNPAWLPYVLQSKAVLCEVGGWLSHMAIVARENNIPMLVGCAGLGDLENGTEIKISKSGNIEFQTHEMAPVKRRAETG